MRVFAPYNPLLLLAGSMGIALSGLAAAEPVEFFENKVRPLLVEHCYSCHSAEAEAKGKLKAAHGFAGGPQERRGLRSGAHAR